MALAPFIVAATPIPRHPWHYATLPGIEILSRASDPDAEWWVQGLQRELALQEELLPDSFNRQFSTPCTLIIDDADPGPARAQMPSVAPIAAATGAGNRELLPVFHPTETLTMGPFSFDQDTFARQSNLFKVQADGRLVMNGWDLSFRLSRQAPIAPSWLREGLCGKYGFMGENVGGWFVHPYAEATLIGRAQFWLTAKDTERIQSLNQDALKAIAPLRFERIFAGDPANAADADLLSCESSLFVRWALIDHHGDPAWTSRFWRFVEAVSREPATEDLFEHCLGFGYSRLDAELAQYLPRATRTQPVVTLSHGVGRVQFRPATSDEEGRILGDWMRMKGENLRGGEPSVAAVAFQLAGKVLSRAYRGDLGLPDEPPSTGTSAPPSQQRRDDAMGEPVMMQPFIVDAARIRDPAFVAVCGLYAHDVGDDARARELLEAAVAAGVQRPAAYRALAQLAAGLPARSGPGAGGEPAVPAGSH